MKNKAITYNNNKTLTLALVTDQIGDLLTIQDKYLIPYCQNLNGNNKMINKSEVVEEYDSLEEAYSNIYQAVLSKYSNIECEIEYSWENTCE